MNLQTPHHDPEKLDRAQLEVVNLHRFFEEWLAGVLPDTDVAFERCVTAMGAQFELITPSGERFDRAALLDQLRGGNGSRGAGFRLWVDNLTTRPLAGGVHLVTYEEWQKNAINSTPADNGRVSSAVLAEAHTLGLPFQWLHLHETWLPPGRIAGEPFDF